MLVGTVDASGALSLTLKGKSVTTLKSGRYTIEVSDHSSRSGFDLQEIRKTALPLTPARFVGNHKVTLDLKPGQWFYYPTFVGKKTYFIVVA